MTVVRRTAALALAGGIAAAAAVLPALPALAHGAPTSPISRTAACAGGGERSDSAACKAARAANGRAFGNFDNLRVPNVNGKDKQVIPDGKLCSGGLSDFRGLDLARTDWPSTKVTAGDQLPIKYRGTIPHQGTFRVYLTKQGYDPTEPLGWGDLGASPILTVQDPPLRGGAYQMTAKLPKDRSGRHVLYTVWQTSSTPDTYYSCSDLQIKARTVAVTVAKTPKPVKTSAAPKASRSPEPGVVASPQEVASPVAAGAPEQAKESWLTPAAAEAEDRVALGHQIIFAALIVIVGVGAGTAFNRWRTARGGRR
jgi:chitin-binding protein